EKLQIISHNIRSLHITNIGIKIQIYLAPLYHNRASGIFTSLSWNSCERASGIASKKKQVTTEDFSYFYLALSVTLLFILHHIILI
ncbi:hypothetical protein LGW37_09735, partial [Streptococcus mutans]|nr:hypothetical protein [Streptococcus mutans]